MVTLERFWSVLLESPKTNKIQSKYARPSRARILARNRPRSPIKTASPLLLVVAVAVLAIVALKSTTAFLASPIQGVVASILPGFYHSSIDMAPRVEAGEYAAFAYPKGLAARPSQAPQGPVVASYNMAYRTVAGWNLAVTIIRVPTGNLADNSAYKLRYINPQTYARSDATFNGQPAVIMTDKTAGGYARVGFLVHGQYQAVVSLTGQDRGNVGDLESTLSMVLGSWRWLKG